MLQNHVAKARSWTPPRALGMGGRDHVRHVQPSSGSAKSGQVSVDGWNDQRLVSRRGVIFGQRLHGVCPRFSSSAPTSPKATGSRCLRGEGLVTSDGELSGPVEMLWHTGAPLHLTDEGIAHLGEIAGKTQGHCFLLDSYHSCCAVLGIDEATSAF